MNSFLDKKIERFWNRIKKIEKEIKYHQNQILILNDKLIRTYDNGLKTKKNISK
jgi:hypothetical protein